MIAHQIVKVTEYPKGSRVYVHADKCLGCKAGSPLPQGGQEGGTWLWI